MRLYPKRLNGLKDLQREKLLLKKEREELTIHHVLSEQTGNLRDAMPGKIAGALLDNINIESVGSVILSFLPIAVQNIVGRKIKRTVLSVAGTVITGFLKWEAVELGFRGLRLLVRMQKNKRRGKQ